MARQSNVVNMSHKRNVTNRDASGKEVRIRWRPEEELRVLVAARIMREDPKPRAFKTTVEFWTAAQKLAALAPDRQRPIGSSVAAGLNTKYQERKRAGELDFDFDTSHSHVPLHKRPLVPRQQKPAASPTPVPASPPAPAPAITQAPPPLAAAEPITPPLPTSTVPPASGQGLLAEVDKLIGGYLSRLMERAAAPALAVLIQQQRESEQRILATLGQMVPPPTQAPGPTPAPAPAVDLSRLEQMEQRLGQLAQDLSGIDSRLLRLLNIWDDSAPRSESEARSAAPVPPEPAKPPEQNYRIYVCSGVHDQFWDSLHLLLPECKVDYGNDKLQHTMPKGKQYDLVVTNWATAGGSFTVLEKHYYKQLLRVRKGQEKDLPNTIMERLRATFRV